MKEPRRFIYIVTKRCRAKKKTLIGYGAVIAKTSTEAVKQVREMYKVKGLRVVVSK